MLTTQVHGLLLFAFFLLFFQDDLGEIGVVHDEDDVDEPEEEEEEEEEDEEEEELEGFDPRVEQPSLAEEEEEEIPRLHPVQINYPRNSQKRSHQPNKKQRVEGKKKLFLNQQFWRDSNLEEKRDFSPDFSNAY